MSWKKRTLKYTLFTLTSIGASLILSVWILLQWNIPQQKIKKILEKDLSEKTNQTVTIEKFSGNLFTQVDIYNAILTDKKSKETPIKAPKITLKYSIIELIKYAGYIPSALKEIEIDNAEITLHRTKDGNWILPHLEVKKREDEFILSKPFQGNLKFKNAHIYYKDEKGWQKIPLKTAYTDEIKEVNATLFFRRNNTIQLKSTGTLKSTNGKIDATGYYDLQKNSYEVELIAQKINAKTLLPYCVYLKDYEYTNNTPVRIKVNLKNKQTPQTHHLPFWYKITVSVKNGEFKLPFFTPTIKNISGTLELYEGKISKEHLKQALPSFSDNSTEALLQYLKKENYITNEGFRTETPFKHAIWWPKKFRKHKKTIETVLNNPQFELYFNSLNGNISQIQANLNGSVNLNKHKTELSLHSTKTFPLSSLKELLTATAQWDYEGESTGNISITGPFQNISLKGSLHAKNIKSYTLEGKQALVDFEYKNHTLTVLSQKITLSEGGSILSGTVTLTHPSALSLDIKIKDENLAHLLKTSKKTVEGKYNANIQLKGPLSQFEIKTSLKSNLKFYHQTLSQIDCTIPIINGNLENFTGEINANNTKLPFKGELNDAKDLIISLETKALPLYLPKENTKALLDSSSVLFLPIKTKKEIEIETKGKLKNIIYQEETFKEISFNIHKKGAKTELTQIEILQEDSNTQLQGTLQNTAIEELSLYAKNINLEKNLWIYPFIKLPLFPQKGIVSLKLSLKAKELENTFLLKNYLVKGEITAEKIKFYTQLIDKLKSTFTLDKGKFNSELLQIDHKNSHLSATFKQTDTESLLTLLNGSMLNLSDFTPLLKPIGALSGTVFIEGKIKNIEKNPEYALKIEGNALQYNTLSISKLNTELTYLNHKWTIENGHIQTEKSIYTVSGNYNAQENFPQYALNIKLEKGELSEWAQTYQILTHNLKNIDTKTPSFTESVKSPNINISFSKGQNLQTKGVLYSVSDTNSLLNQFNPYEEAKEIQELSPLNFISGQIEGNLKISSQEKNILPKIEALLQINTLQIGSLSSKEGQLRFMKSATQNQFEFYLKNGLVQNNPFEFINCNGYITNDNELHIIETAFKKNGTLSRQFLTGHFPLYPTKSTSKLNITLNLEKNNISLLSILDPKISTLQNDGEIYLLIEGTPQNPILSKGKISLKNFEMLYNKQIRSLNPLKTFLGETEHHIKINNSLITIDQNTLTLPETEIVWTSTKYLLQKRINSNTLKAKGEIKLQSQLYDYIDYTFNLEIDPTLLTLDLPQYTGTVIINNTKFIGTLRTALSEKERKKQDTAILTNTEKGPLLSSVLKFQEGTLKLKNSGEKEALPSILLNIESYFGQDVFVSSSFLGQGVLSGVATDFEINPDDSELKLTGSLNHPYIEKSVVFSEGSLNIFNKEFELLKENNQNNYLKLISKTPHKNKIEFEITEDKNGMKKNNSYINLSGITIIQDPNTLTTNSESIIKSYTHALVKIEGSVDNLQVFEFNFYKSAQEQFNAPDLELKKSLKLNTQEKENFAEQNTSTEILEELFPEFFTDTIDRDKILNQAGGQRITQLARRELFRPIEKQVSKKIGLYDFRINYDLGSSLLEKQNPNSERIDISAVQRLLSDQVFLRVKTLIDFTSQEQTNTDPVSISEVELTYYPFKKKNISLNYATLKNDAYKSEYRQKLSLKYNYDF